MPTILDALREFAETLTARRIVEGPTIPEADLPTPTETERKAPTE